MPFDATVPFPRICFTEILMYIYIKIHFKDIYLFIQQIFVEPVFMASTILNTGASKLFVARKITALWERPDNKHTNTQTGESNR